MRTKRITNNRASQIRYPIPQYYKPPKPIFLDRDPDMPKTWYGWVVAFLIAACVIVLPNLIV